VTEGDEDYLLDTITDNHPDPTVSNPMSRSSPHGNTVDSSRPITTTRNNPSSFLNDEYGSYSNINKSYGHSNEDILSRFIQFTPFRYFFKKSSSSNCSSYLPTPTESTSLSRPYTTNMKSNTNSSSASKSYSSSSISSFLNCFSLKWKSNTKKNSSSSPSVPYAIRMNLRSIMQLFNTLDQCPFFEQMLDKEGEEWIITQAKEANYSVRKGKGGGFLISIRLDQLPLENSDYVKRLIQERELLKQMYQNNIINDNRNMNPSNPIYSSSTNTNSNSTSSSAWWSGENNGFISDNDGITSSTNSKTNNNNNNYKNNLTNYNYFNHPYHESGSKQRKVKKTAIELAEEMVKEQEDQALMESGRFYGTSSILTNTNTNTNMTVTSMTNTSSIIAITRKELVKWIRDDLKKVMNRHFTFRAKQSGSEIRETLYAASTSFLLGILTLLLCLILSRGVDVLASQLPSDESSNGKSTFDAKTWAGIGSEALDIVGWVALWRPLEMILFSWTPLYERKRLMIALSNSRVELFVNER